MTTRRRDLRPPSRRAFLGLAGAAAAGSFATRASAQTPGDIPRSRRDAHRVRQAVAVRGLQALEPRSRRDGIVLEHAARRPGGASSRRPVSTSSDTTRACRRSTRTRTGSRSTGSSIVRSCSRWTTWWRMSSVSRFHFIECSGNSAREWSPAGAANVQLSHGLASCSEWTGVLLADLLDEVGVKPEAGWIVAEGADAGLMSRSVPLERALDDVMIAYGQNGEAVRPEQGYPLRLLVPGCEGSISVKWLRRIEVAHMPSDGPRRDLEVHGPPAGRQGAPVHAGHGREVRHHPALGRAEAGPARLLRDPRPGLVRPRHDLPRRGCRRTAAARGPTPRSTGRAMRRRSPASDRPGAGTAAGTC